MLRRYWPAFLLAVPLWLYIAYPIGSILAESLQLPVAAYRAKKMGWDPNAQPMGAGLRVIFSEGPLREAVWGSLKLSVLSAILACVWGLGLALLWYRRDFPGRRIFAASGYAPMLLPPLVGTLAWFHLAGPTGWLWQWLGGTPLVGSFGQILLLHTYAFGLLPFSFVAAALENYDASTEDAARNLGASGFKTFLNTVWPAIRAPLVAGGLLAFMAAAASFSGPYILDNSGRYLTVEILNDPDPSVQRGLSVILAAMALAALPPFLYFNRAVPGGSGSKGAARKNLPRESGVLLPVRMGLSALVAVILLAPPIMVIKGALFPVVISNFADGNSLSAGFRALQPVDWASLERSAGYAAIAACINLVLAVLLALALRRANWKAALPSEIAVMLALALPGSVVGVALLSVFNAGSWLSLGAPLGGTGVILILAYTVRNLPFAVRPVRAALQESGGDLENAALNLGASRVEVFYKITLPLMAPTLIAAFLICFVNGSGEFVASKLLYDVRTQPVSVRIDELFRTNAHAAYALALMLMVLTGVAIGLATWLQKRWSYAGR